jgi:hypothetical protein
MVAAFSSCFVGVNRLIALSVAAIVAVSAGCSHYTTPGAGADMRIFGGSRDQQSDASVVQALAKNPLATFPTAVAVIRVQGPGYSSRTAEGWGRGAFSVVTARDIENMEAKLAELRRLPMIVALVPINRLLLPAELHSDLDLRQAAGALHADVVLVYTLDTTFQVQDVAAPLTVITLGLSPNQVAHVSCTASAVLMDTRNGYVYGVAEETEQQNQLASGWTNEAAVDQTRKRVEAKAFDKLVASLEATWREIVITHSHSRQTATSESQ